MGAREVCVCVVGGASDRKFMGKMCFLSLSSFRNRLGEAKLGQGEETITPLAKFWVSGMGPKGVAPRTERKRQGGARCNKARK